jgi:hypothetical protein
VRGHRGHAPSLAPVNRRASPVSWFVVEPGWPVVDSAGEGIGRVVEAVGEPDEDIFSGVTFSTGRLARTRYVPAEYVAEISAGCVRLALRAGELEALEPYESPPGSRPS